MIPFSDARTIDMQGDLLIVAGGFAWCALLLGSKVFTLDKWSNILVKIFLVCCLISVFVNPHVGYDIFGAPYIRLGAAGMFACIGIGLLLKSLPYKSLVLSLYSLIVSIAVVSVPYSWWRFHSLIRIGGVFSQADIFAVYMGAGFLLGLFLFRNYAKYRWLFVGAQFLLMTLLVLSETRAVIVLVAFFFILHQLQGSLRLQLLSLFVLPVIVVGLLIPAGRLTDLHYAKTSTSYRFDLQLAALGASTHKPLFGYGLGNLADSLSCSHLYAPALQKTCHEGFFFNSSHDIFMDRVLAVGWIGGLAYITFVVRALYRGWRAKSDELLTLVVVASLIALYYLTNVTSVTIELLLWILVVYIAAASSRKAVLDN